MKSEIKYGKEVPSSYLSFLNKYPNGCYIDFRVDPEYESSTKIFGENELTENIEMNSIGNALQFESMKLYITFQRKFGFADVDKPKLTDAEMKRIENGFVIGYGENYGGYGYLYLDGADNHSVWVYNTNDGQIMKVFSSFEDLISQAKIID